jgi:hypothetical protein
VSRPVCRDPISRLYPSILRPTGYAVPRLVGISRMSPQTAEKWCEVLPLTRDTVGGRNSPIMRHATREWCELRLSTRAAMPIEPILRRPSPQNGNFGISAGDFLGFDACKRRIDNLENPNRCEKPANSGLFSHCWPKFRNVGIAWLAFVDEYRTTRAAPFSEIRFVFEELSQFSEAA